MGQIDLWRQLIGASPEVTTRDFCQASFAHRHSICNMVKDTDNFSTHPRNFNKHCKRQQQTPFQSGCADSLYERGLERGTSSGFIGQLVGV